MKALSGPVVILDGTDCAVLGQQLADTIQLAYNARGAPAPRALLDFSVAVNRLARRSSQDTAGSETTRFPAGPFLPPSEQPVMLTATEAARIAQVSVQYTRKCLRRGDLRGSRGHQGAWRVDAVEVAAWISRRREENDPKAALWPVSPQTTRATWRACSRP